MGDRDFILGHGQFVKSPGTFMEGMSGLGIPGTEEAVFVQQAATKPPDSTTWQQAADTPLSAQEQVFLARLQARAAAAAAAQPLGVRPPPPPQPPPPQQVREPTAEFPHLPAPQQHPKQAASGLSGSGLPARARPPLSDMSNTGASQVHANPGAGKPQAVAAKATTIKIKVVKPAQQPITKQPTQELAAKQPTQEPAAKQPAPKPAAKQPAQKTAAKQPAQKTSTQQNGSKKRPHAALETQQDQADEQNDEVEEVEAGLPFRWSDARALVLIDTFFSNETMVSLAKRSGVKTRDINKKAASIISAEIGEFVSAQSVKNYRCKLKAAYQKKHAAIDKYSSATGGGGGEPGGEWDDADVIAVKGISREVYEAYDKWNSGSHVTKAPGLIDTGETGDTGNIEGEGEAVDARDGGLADDELEGVNEDGEQEPMDAEEMEEMIQDHHARGPGNPVWAADEIVTPSKPKSAGEAKLEPKKSASKSAVESRHQNLQDLIAAQMEQTARHRESQDRYRESQDRREEAAEQRRELRRQEDRKDKLEADERESVRKHEFMMMFGGAMNSINKTVSALNKTE